jgi:SAM-dependent methyltransferase
VPETTATESQAAPRPGAGRCPVCETALEGTPKLRSPDRHHGVPGEFGVMVCACGAGVTLPRVEPRELGAYYPAGYGAYEATEGGPLGLISRAIRSWQGFRALRTFPLSALRDRPPGRALDVGCGRGDLGATLIRRGWRVTGVEPSRDACAVASRRGIDARCGGVADVRLEPGAYDAAVFRHSLEHLPDPLGDLRRIADALRPGGLLLVSVPNFGGWQARRFGSRWYHLDLPRHRVHLRREALGRALEVTGFEPLDLRTSTSTVGLPASVQYALFGRCLFPSGLPLRVATGLCVLAYPAAWALDRLGGGDVLHAAARRR